MASILRSSKFVRYIAGFAKNVVVNTPREFDGNFVNTKQCLCGAVPRSLATQAQSSSQHEQNQNLEKSLRKIDQDVRKSGRISRRDIEEVLEDIRSGGAATSSQSLLIIRCCGNLVPEELPQVRTKLVEEIWNTLRKLNVPMDISHYNALLRVYLENEHEFSPTEFLAELENKGIEPNRVTYQRLVARYCQIADIEGVTKILEYMREKQLAVNENVFNALIMGHSQAGDMESAYGILSVMSRAGLEPSADTYTTLLCGYAKNGDIDSVKKVLQECEEKEIFLLDKDYLEIVYALVINGHTQHMPLILEKVRRALGYNQDAINLILRLINKGEDEAAYEVLKSMPRSSKPDGNLLPSGNFFIKQLVKANRPIETVLKLCQRLEDENMFTRAFLLAAETSLQIGNDKLAYPLLEELKKSGTEIRQHYFWPLLLSKKTDKDIVEVLTNMQRLGIHPSNETLREYVIPNLKGRSTDIIATLREANVSLGASASSLVVSLLNRNEIEEAAIISSKINAYYNPDIIKKPLTSAFIKTKDINNYVAIFRVIYDNLEKKQYLKQEEGEQPTSSVDKIEVLGSFILDLANNKKTVFLEYAEPLLDALVKQGLSISTTAAEKIEDRLGEKMTNSISKLLGKLTSGELTPIPVERKTPSYTPSSQMNIPQLERLIANLEAKNQETKGLRRQLFTLYYRAKDLEKAEALMKDFSKGEFVLTSGVHAQIIDLYAYHDKVDKAMEHYEKLQQLEGAKFVLDEEKIIRLTHSLVKNDRFEDALKILETTPRERKLEERNYNYTSSVWRLLNLLADQGRTEDLTKLFDTLIQKEFIEVNNVILGPLIKVHLVNKDLDKALEKFEWCVNQFKATPWKNELACQLIQSEDADKLQKLTDLSTGIHGEINSLYDLVFAFVECGRVKQARKILETPGLQNRPQRINNACERYRTEGMVKPLEGLKDATKDLNHIDRSDIYYQLLLSYIKQDESSKALGLWTQMQEEDLAPTEQFLITLGEYLTDKGFEVPFVVPKTIPINVPKFVEFVQTSTEPKNTPQQLFRQHVKDGQLDAALKVKKGSPDKFAINDVSALIEKLVQHSREKEATKLALELMDKGNLPVNRIFRFLLNKLASNGDLESLNLLGSKMDNNVKKIVSFDNRICHANLVAGKGEEYLSSLEKQIDRVQTKSEIELVGEQFPRGGAYGILEKNPELLQKYENVAVKFAQKGIVAPMNVLWTHYFIADDQTRAEQIWNDHLKGSPRIMFQRIVQTAREKKDDELIRKLITHLKISNVTEGAIGNAYSCMLDVLHAKNMEEELINTFETAVKDVNINSINRTAVLRVKEVYDKLGKPFDYKIPPKVNNKSGTSSSSSSEEVNRVKS